MIQLTWPLYLALPLITLIVGMLAGAIRRHEVKLHADEKTRADLEDMERDRDWWKKEFERVSAKNRDITSNQKKALQDSIRMVEFANRAHARFLDVLNVDEAKDKKR